MVLKKSELRQMIREALREELSLKEEIREVINEDGVQATLDRAVRDNLCGINLGGVEVGIDVYTQPSNRLECDRTTTNNDIISVYSYHLTGGFNAKYKDAILKSEALQKGVNAVKQLYADDKRMKIEHKVWCDDDFNGASVYYDITVIPDYKNGYVLQSRYYPSRLRGQA
jgi:uncharacterized protein (UPF0335 family)